MPVKLYSTPTCPWCKEAKKFLSSKGVAFQEVDVSKDRKLVEELHAVSGQLGVPVTIDGKTIVIGFSKPALEKLAAAAK
ncbi:MAG: glutaredoxin family protein [Methanobacteriota archaeon]|nr:MAG: glutaredoxin family protein [Euryarchaeota archaeon]